MRKLALLYGRHLHVNGHRLELLSNDNDDDQNVNVTCSPLSRFSRPSTKLDFNQEVTL